VYSLRETSFKISSIRSSDKKAEIVIGALYTSILYFLIGSITFFIIG